MEAFEREEHVLIAVGEPVRALHAREMLQHGLLHRELPEKTRQSGSMSISEVLEMYLIQVRVQ